MTAGGPACRMRVDAPSLYHLVEAAMVRDEPRFHAILGCLTQALIEGGMESPAVLAWADRICAMLGLPADRYRAH